MVITVYCLLVALVTVVQVIDKGPRASTYIHKKLKAKAKEFHMVIGKPRPIPMPKA